MATAMIGARENPQGSGTGVARPSPRKHARVRWRALTARTSFGIGSRVTNKEKGKICFVTPFSKALIWPKLFY